MLYTLWVQIDLRWRNVQNFETLEAGREAMIQRSLGHSRLMRLTRYQFHEQVPVLYAIHGDVLVIEKNRRVIGPDEIRTRDEEWDDWFWKD